LWKSLQLAEKLVAQGERNVEKIVDQMRKVILAAEDARSTTSPWSIPNRYNPCLA